MSYAVDPTQALPVELERVARHELDAARLQLSQALDQLAGGGASLTEPVHEVRKGFKRLRALLRLVRPALDPRAFAQLNSLLRDAARTLSGGRDATVLAALFGTFAGDGMSSSAWEAVAPFGGKLAARSRDFDAGAREHLETVLGSLGRLETGVEGLVPPETGTRDLIAGLGLAYARARRAMRRAARGRSDELFHEWRKNVKYVRHHLELLQPAAPDVLGAMAGLCHELADRLGENNDLAVLKHEVRAALDACEQENDVALGYHQLLERLGERQLQLQTRALDLGRQLFAEKRRAYAARLRLYWNSALRA